MSGNLKLSPSAPLVNVQRRPRSWTDIGFDRFGLAASLDWTVILTLALLVILGFGLRFTQLNAIGFAEDEINKLDAVHSYRQGDFSVNAEHPMVMKLLMMLSLNAAPNSSEETALRLPNVVVGALTVVPLFLLTYAFFDRKTALIAAAFWAFGINAITHNRIGKEDSLLVFFMLFGLYFFVRAKQTSPRDVPVRRKNYFASAISFGLMIASKYFPHFLGLNMLFHHLFHVRTPAPGELSGRTPKAAFFAIIAIVFLLANPAVLMPHVWQYMSAYVGEKLLTHTGYLFAGTLYKNNMSSSPFWGTPVYFYALFLAIKVPLLVLVGFLVGLIESVRRRRNVGFAFLLFMFLFWIITYSFIGGKWLRYTLSLMPFVYMIAAVGVAALATWIRSRFSETQGSLVLSALVIAIFVGVPAWTSFAHGPHYALYTNALAADKQGFYFPHDEFYDDGLREAIKYVADHAPQGTSVAHETPGVVRHYLTVFNRTDLNSYPISSPDFDLQTAPGTVYVIAQRGRTYFENRDELDFARSNFRKVNEIFIDGRSAVEVFVNH